MEDGRLIGVVDRVQILTAIAGLEDQADAGAAEAGTDAVEDGRTLSQIAAADVAAEAAAEQRALDAALAGDETIASAATPPPGPEPGAD